MEKIGNNNEFLNSFETKLQQKVAIAKFYALSSEEYEEISEADFESANIQNKRELTSEEALYYKQLRDRKNEATIKVETLVEARRVMEILGRSTFSINDTLSHENAHANKADQLGAEHNGYEFVLIRENGDYDVAPQASYYVPDEWSKEKQKEVNIKITQAPDEYGNKMSDGDKRYLEDLKND